MKNIVNQSQFAICKPVSTELFAMSEFQRETNWHWSCHVKEVDE